MGKVVVNDRGMSQLSEQIIYSCRCFELNIDQIELARGELADLSGRYQLFEERNFQFWKLLLGAGARQELPHATDIFRCDPNIVVDAARREDVPCDLALRTVRQWGDDAITEFVDATCRARKAAPPCLVTDYLEFIESCTAGNLQSMLSLTSRYS